jgi:phage tail sheath protein FI
MPTYDVPGVYIQEITGPGVIVGVSTSTTAFIGPALAGPLMVAQPISSWDQFCQIYGAPQPDGSYFPYLTSPRWFYMAHGVRGFFQNGGAQAYVVRVGTAANTTWNINDQDATTEAVFRLQAQKEGVGGDSIKIAVSAVNYTTAAGVAVANPTANVTLANGTLLTVDDPSGFLPGDEITDGTTLATISQINTTTKIITVSAPLTGTKLRIADLAPAPNLFPFRTATTTGLYPGTVAILQNADGTKPQYVVVQSVDRAGFVTLAGTPGLTNTYSMAGPKAPVLISQEFQLVITPPAPAAAETWTNLSLSPLHPNYVFAAVQSDLVNVLPPLVPPVSSKYPDILVAAASPVPISVNGAPDNPASLTASNYDDALDLLSDIEGVNLLCIPDASSHPEAITIQQSMIAHCFSKLDRFAILDSQQGAPKTGPGSVSLQRESVQAPSGVAALYYPWLNINDPTWKPTPTNATPAILRIPPSGAIAGIYAQVDQAIGVHKAPANVALTGVVGLESVLSDGQQGPLNLAGIDVLRIFPGSGVVTVWGARTTGDPNVTDWIYVNVRRLMIYIEQSIKTSIRSSVFQPNGPPLWGKLKRVITEFLTNVYQSGALVGDTAAQAFYVKIDSTNNTPATMAVGQLYIEIGVAPARPAEFIIVRIGLWDGGAQLSES